MSSHDTDEVFAGSIPELYDTHLVPLIFEPYAADLADRLVNPGTHNQYRHLTAANAASEEIKHAAL